MNCRICKSNNYKSVLNLGSIYPSNFVSDSPNIEPKPLHLVQCNNCNLVQLEETFDLDVMYKEHYWYRSGLNSGMVNSLKEIVDQIKLRKPECEIEQVLDIGCNDGTLLGFYGDNVWKVGVDPSKNVKESASKICNYFINDYFTAEALKVFHCNKIERYYKFDVITSIAMFYDLENPNQFVSDIKKVLDVGGIWVIQFTDLLSMLKCNAFDNICLGKDELVVTEFGLKRIQDINIGDRVLTHRGRFRKVTNKFISAYRKDYLIELKSYGTGFGVKVTENHPIWVQRNNQWLFVPASDIKLNDIVGKPVIYDTDITYDDNLEITEHIAKIIGYYLSEGSYNKSNNSVNFYFNINEEYTHAEDLIQALKASGYSANKYFNYKNNVLHITTYGKIVHWLEKHFKHHATKKTIPMWLLSQPDHILQHVLKTYINGDGYIYRNNNYYRATTVSQDLAYGISLLANKLGYKCSINKQQTAKNKKIQGRVVNLNDVWDILIHLNPKQKQKVWVENSIQCSRIKKIENVPYTNKVVYNLEVEDDNTYVTPAMTVHNCHEHLEYYTLDVLHNLLLSHGLEIFDVEYNNVNGGSVRVYVRHLNSARFEATDKLKDALEYEYIYLTKHPIEEFSNKILQEKSTLLKLISDIKNSNETIYVLGASTKGNTLLQHYGLTSDTIDKALEVNKDKFGLKTIGTNIPIISEEEGLKEKPDYLLILPWAFRDFFDKKFKDYLLGGGRLIYPLPEVTVIRE